jgi:hypothetical protein
LDSVRGSLSDYNPNQLTEVRRSLRAWQRLNLAMNRIIPSTIGDLRGGKKRGLGMAKFAVRPIGQPTSFLCLLLQTPRGNGPTVRITTRHPICCPSSCRLYHVQPLRGTDNTTVLLNEFSPLFLQTPRFELLFSYCFILINFIHPTPRSLDSGI